MLSFVSFSNADLDHIHKINSSIEMLLNTLNYRNVMITDFVVFSPKIFVVKVHVVVELHRSVCLKMMEINLQMMMMMMMMTEFFVSDEFVLEVIRLFSV